MTMKYAAMRLDVCTSTISKIEHGQQELTLYRFVQMCRLYQISAPALIAEQLNHAEQVTALKQIAGLL